MNWLVKTISTRIKNGYRYVKHLGLGKDDVQETHYAQAFGTDANPTKDLIGVFAQTGVRGEAVVVGFINKHQLAAVGDHRLFSTSEDGKDVKFSLWMKNDGTCEIGGADDNMVRYSKLEEAFNAFRDDLNDLVAKFNNHTHPYTDTGAIPTTAAETQNIIPVQMAEPSNVSIVAAKIEEIKTL